MSLIKNICTYSIIRIIVVFISIQTIYGQNLKYETWICESGAFENSSFIRDGNFWKNNEYSYEYKTLSDSYDECILIDEDNNVLVKLTSTEVFISKDLYNPTWISKGKGYWLSKLPTAFYSKRSSIYYGDSTILKISSDGALVPFDNWIVQEEIEGSIVNHHNFQNELQVRPERTTSYRLFSKRDKSRSIVIKVFVDTTTQVPNNVDYKKIGCKDEIVELKIVNGRLGKGAVLEWSSNYPTVFPTFVSRDSKASFKLSENITIFLRVLINGVEVKKFECEIGMETPSKRPKKFEIEGNICAGKKTKIKLVGGSLGVGANWTWMIDNSVYLVTEKREIDIEILKDIKVSVFAMNNCNITDLMSTNINLEKYNINDAYIKSQATTDEDRRNILLSTSIPTVFNLSYTWTNTRNNKIISNNPTINVEKVKKRTNIRLDLSNSCGDSQTLYFEGKTYIKEIKINKAKEKKEEKEYKLSKAKESKNKKEEQKKEEQKKEEQKKQEQKKEEQKKEEQKLNNSVGYSKTLDKRVYLGGAISTGLKNNVGYLGLSGEYYFLRNASITVGGGLSVWGNKSNLELKFFTKNTREGLAMSIGYTHNRGVLSWTTEFETTQNISEVVELRLLPVSNVYLGLYFYGKNTGRNLSPYWMISYSRLLSNEYYELIEGNPLNANSEDILRVLRPGGLGIGLGIRF